MKAVRSQGAGAQRESSPTCGRGVTGPARLAAGCSTPNERLIIFLKAPRPGYVKTRLAEKLGPEGAAQAYQILLSTLVAALKSLPSVQLRFSPDDAREEISPWLQPGWEAEPQGKGELGERLERAFAAEFSRGTRRVVVIGSDCPDVVVSDLQRACSRLAAHDLVLGPARDGGYWMIGLRQPVPLLFRGIPWSTSEVLLTTLERAAAARLTVYQSRRLADVDTLAGWRGYLRRRTGQGTTPPSG